MPTHIIEVNGKTHRVQAPADATDEQLLAALEAQEGGTPALPPTHGAKTPPEPSTRAGGHGPGMAGAADAAIRAYLGTKGLFTELDDDERGVLREQEKEAAEDDSPWTRTAGNIAGNILLTAVPAARFAKYVGAAAKALPKALSAVLPAAAVSGGQGVVLNPPDPEAEGYKEQIGSKAKSAGVDALAGGAFGGAGQVLKKALTGMFRPTAEAKRLMDEGILTPTIQQGGESKIAKFIGGLTSGAVDISKRQNREVLDAYLRQVAPSIDASDMTVPDKVGLLRRHFLGDSATGAMGEYDKLLSGKKYILSQPKRQAIWDAASGKKGTQPEATQMATQAMGGTGAAMTSSTTVPMGYKKLREYRGLLQDAIDSMSGGDTMSQQAKSNLIAARQKFDQLVRDPALSPDERAALREIDTKFTDFLRFQEAAKVPSFHTKPKASTVLQKYKEMDPAGGVGFAQATSPTQRDILEPALRTMGEEPKQDMARTLLVNAKRAAAGAAGIGAVAGNPFATLAAPFYGVSLAGQTKGGAEMLFGQQEWQKALAKYMQEAAPYLAGSGQSLTGGQ